MSSITLKLQYSGDLIGFCKYLDQSSTLTAIQICVAPHIMNNNFVNQLNTQLNLLLFERGALDLINLNFRKHLKQITLVILLTLILFLRMIRVKY